MGERVTLNHGGGGAAAAKFIREVFTGRFGIHDPLTDSSLLKEDGITLAFTTDSYVVDPLFFPGGDIGKMAVCGTVNDLSVSGAIPACLSASFIIEEGFPVDDLEKIAGSMAAEAQYAGVRIVTGDTKVVDRGKCDKLFITTSGTGIMRPGLEHIGSAARVKAGDKLIINGSLGNHSIAVLGARKELSFTAPVESDCASLNHIIDDIIKASDSIHFMRDLTRGGLASVLNELQHMIKYGILINEREIPVDEPVAGLCEMFGFDPLYLANEGKILVVVSEADCGRVIEAMKANPLGINSEIIGEITQDYSDLVIVSTVTGGKRILDLPSGIQLPRIC